MDSATRASALTAQVLERSTTRALEDSFRRRTSPVWLGVFFALIVALWFMPVVQASLPLRLALASWWAARTAMALAFRRTNVSRLTRGLEALGELAAAGASATAIYAVGTLATPVWLMVYARDFAWWPRAKLAIFAQRWGTVGAQVALASTWAAQGHTSRALIVLALLAGQIIILEVSTQVLRQRLELEAEADELHRQLQQVHARRESERIARELHDGLGADLVALNLSLRNKGPVAQPYQQAVLTLLDELRSVVWSLRGGHGSLGEFEKVVRSRARTSLASLEVLPVDLAQRAAPVSPKSALAALLVLHALATRVSANQGGPALQVTLAATPGLLLELRLVAPADALAPLAALAGRALEGSLVAADVTSRDGVLRLAFAEA